MSYKHKVFEVHITGAKQAQAEGEKDYTTDDFYLQNQFLPKEELKVNLTLWQL